MKQAAQYSKLPYNERFFIELFLPSPPDKCDVLIHPMPKACIHVYTQDKFVLRVAFSDSTYYKATASYGLAEVEGELGTFIFPQKERVSEGRLMIDFLKKITDSDLVGIVVRPDNDMQLGPLLNDISGVSQWREYNNLKGGSSNIILLSMAGFSLRGTAHPDPVSVTLRFYANHASKVKLESASLLHNHDKLQRFFRSNKIAFFDQQ